MEDHQEVFQAEEVEILKSLICDLEFFTWWKWIWPADSNRRGPVCIRSTRREKDSNFHSHLKFDFLSIYENYPLMRMLIITSETLINPSGSNASNGRLFTNSLNNFKQRQKIIVSVQLDRSNCFSVYLEEEKLEKNY